MPFVYIFLFFFASVSSQFGRFCILWPFSEMVNKIAVCSAVERKVLSLQLAAGSPYDRQSQLT